MPLSPAAEPIALSVVIPFFNEAPNVAALLAEVREALGSFSGSWEIVAVDDGSADGTARELRECGKRFSGLTSFNHRENCGQAAALWRGFAAARGAVIVTLDGDGQNDPADIPRLLAALETGADLVAGVRVERRDSSLRRVMSRAANAVRGRMLGDGVRDTGCALKAFRREVCGSFLPIRTLYSFMPAFAVAAGFRVEEMPVRHRPRKAGASKYGLGVMLWRPLIDLLGVWWFTHRRFPTTDEQIPDLAENPRVALVPVGDVDDLPRHARSQ
jgi:dolichol-phosphate mannosyltransferase